MTPALLDTSKVIVGQSGSGKTVTAKDEVRQLLEERRHVVVVDPTGVWWGLRSNAAGDGPGFDIPIFGGRRGDVPIRPDQGEAIGRIILEQRVSAIVDLSAIDNSRDWRMFMLTFVAELRRRVHGNFHLVIDEADEFAAERPVDDLAFALRENLVFIAKRGRVQGFVPTWITQRTPDIAKAVISQAQTIIAHQLMSPSDQKPIDDYLKGHANAAVRKEVIGSLAELTIGERWIYSPRLKVLERGMTPALTTFDSSRTPAAGEQLVVPRTLAELDVSAIRAALAPTAAPDGRGDGYPDDAIPADPRAALEKGAVVGSMLHDRDRRIAELEAQVGDLQAELDELREVDQECDRYQAGLEAIEQLVEAVRNGRPWTWLHRDNRVSGAESDKPSALEHSSPAPVAEGASLEKADSPIATPRDAPDLPPRRRRLLDAISWANAFLKKASVPRSIVAWIAETTAASSTFERDCGALRTAGLVDYPVAGELALTPAGKAIALKRHAPATREHLWRTISAKLPPRQVEIVEVLWGGETFARSDLAELAGTTPASSTFERDLGRLRTLGLIDYPSQGKVTLAELLR